MMPLSLPQQPNPRDMRPSIGPRRAPVGIDEADALAAHTGAPRQAPLSHQVLDDPLRRLFTGLPTKSGDNLSMSSGAKQCRSARVRRWIDRHAQVALVESSYDGGVRLVVQLPVTEVDAARAALSNLTHGRAAFAGAQR